MDIHTAFMIGAMRLAANHGTYSDLHKSYGIPEHDWKLLTQQEYWSQQQAQQIRSILAAVVEVSMTIAGMPAVPMPGQYVAAVIATCVAPANRFVAAMKVPDTFDAVDASGIIGTHEIKPMSHQQIFGLVLAYSADFVKEPPAARLPDEVTEFAKAAAESKKAR